MNNALTILGSSSALPTSERFPTAQVLQILGRFFLIDCGEGTQMQLRKMKVPFSKIQAICISHLHGDHYLGVFGVLSTFNLLGRKEELTIYAPSKFQEILDFYFTHVDSNLSYKISFKPLPNDEYAEIYVDKKISVKSFKVKHKVPCWGFKFEERQLEKKILKEAIADYNLSLAAIVKIKLGEDYITEEGFCVPNNELTHPSIPSSYVFVTDTTYQSKIIPYISNATLLYHEATFDESLISRAKQTFHSTAKQAALIALESNAKTLVIGHFSARYKDASILLQEALEVFPNVLLAKDLETYYF